MNFYVSLFYGKSKGSSICFALYRHGQNAAIRTDKFELSISLKGLKRRTTAFLKSKKMHDAVIKLYVHYHNLRQHKI